MINAPIFRFRHAQDNNFWILKQVLFVCHVAGMLHNPLLLYTNSLRMYHACIYGSNDNHSAAEKNCKLISLAREMGKFDPSSLDSRVVLLFYKACVVNVHLAGKHVIVYSSGMI